jgi:two-component system nitrate/nitrite response regulator NarL
VADHYRLGELVSAFRAGANGYFVDVMACDVFIKSIELVMMGETIFPPAFLSFVLDPEGDPLGEAALKTTRRCSSGPRTHSRRSFPRGRNQSCAA